MRLSFLKLFASIVGFVLVGTPLVAYLWDALNRLMTGTIDGRRLAIGAVAALSFAAYLRLLMLVLWRWEGTGGHQTTPDSALSGRTRG
jgi:hypothetical protein